MRYRSSHFVPYVVRNAGPLRWLCCLTPAPCAPPTLRPAVVRQLEDEGRRLQRSRLKWKLKPAALYAGLPAAHQLGVFEPAPRSVRKVWNTGGRRDGGDTASHLGRAAAGWGGLPGKACVAGMLRNRHVLPAAPFAQLALRTAVASVAASAAIATQEDCSRGWTLKHLFPCCPALYRSLPLCR